jgi:hypothetical protein
MQVVLAIGFHAASRNHDPGSLAIFGRDPYVPRALYRTRAAFSRRRVAPLVFRAAQRIHMGTAARGAESGT